MHAKKTLAPTISILLAICILFSGCNSHDIIQPSRKEIVGANLLLWDSSMELDIRLDMMLPDDVAVSYNSSVIANGTMAQWDGIAKVYFADRYFAQECQTKCDATGSAKLWRNRWVVSDNTSPAITVTTWLERAKSAGVYHKRPVVPSDYDDALSGLTEECYRITLREEQLDWKSLCDFHLDTLFGGEGKLDAFTDIDVTLFFGSEDLLLDAIMLSAESSSAGWFELTIRPLPSETELDIDMEDTELATGTLTEEWDLLGSTVQDETE